MDPGARGPDETGREFVYAIAGIVALGAALAVGFHSLQSSAGPRQRLPWIAHETPIVSLESFAPMPAPAPVPVARIAPPDTAPPPPVPVRPQAKAAPTQPAAPTTATPPRPAPAQAVPAPTSPAPAPAQPAARPAIALPFVPDTGAPMEVQYVTARRFWDAGGAVIVDARPADEYAAGHIPGAVNLPFDDVQKIPNLAKSLDTRGRAVVITYCGGGTCELSKDLAKALIEAGHRKVLVYMGGLPGWQQAGGPVVTGTAPGEAP